MLILYWKMVRGVLAIEIDDETSHTKSLVASHSFYDDRLKQNSMVHPGWDVYRWAARQMQIQLEAVKVGTK